MSSILGGALAIAPQPLLHQSRTDIGQGSQRATPQLLDEEAEDQRPLHLSRHACEHQKRPSVTIDDPS